jgi:hypothetical protein
MNNDLRLGKYTIHENNQFSLFEEIRPPIIKKNIIYNKIFNVLLRKYNLSNETYDIDNIKKRIIKNESFRTNFLIEIAYNKHLKNQLLKLNEFNKWIKESENIIIL